MNSSSQILGNNLFSFFRGTGPHGDAVLGCTLTEASLVLRWISSPPSWSYRSVPSLELPLIHAQHQLNYVGVLAQGETKMVKCQYQSLTQLPDYFLFQCIMDRNQKNYTPLRSGTLETFVNGGGHDENTADAYTAAKERACDVQGEFVKF